MATNRWLERVKKAHNYHSRTRVDKAGSVMVSDLPPNPTLRSGHSLVPSYVRFHNRTQRTVDVIWINYDGLHVPFKRLQPLEFFDVNTFVTHPWVFRDSETLDTLLVSSKEVFHPEPWDAGFLQDGPWNPQRKLVLITLPVYSLKERCFQVVRHCLTDKNAIYQLDVPVSLQQEFSTFLDRTLRLHLLL